MPGSHIISKSRFDHVTSDQALETENICLQARTVGNYNPNNFSHLVLNLRLLLKTDANPPGDDPIERFKAQWSKACGYRRHILSECPLPGEDWQAQGADHEAPRHLQN